MKPLIKWPGGKSSEINQFLTLIPDYDRYIEPFAGGGAVFFHLNPHKACINDNSVKLMDFYRLVKAQDPEFHRILNLYGRTFDSLRALCEKRYRDILGLYRLYEAAMDAGIPIEELRIHQYLVIEIASDPAVLSELITDKSDFLLCLLSSVDEKFRRTVINNRKKKFSDRDLKENLITGFLAGYYTYFRGVYNEIAAEKVLCSAQYASANFYFIREYCYGSMFRYNGKGEFNIPYGGTSYNRKDFAGKVEYMFQDDVARLMQRTELYNEDFETFLAKVQPGEKDFIFLDPPYDTEFSDYEGHAFGHKDHERLADCLKQTKAQFLLVIKNTDFIFGLYEGSFRMLAFDNKYMYNVRSRNERKSEHLIITNIPEGTVPWLRENI